MVGGSSLFPAQLMLSQALSPTDLIFFKEKKKKEPFLFRLIIRKLRGSFFGDGVGTLVLLVDLAGAQISNIEVFGMETRCAFGEAASSSKPRTLGAPQQFFFVQKQVRKHRVLETRCRAESSEQMLGKQACQKHVVEGFLRQLLTLLMGNYPSKKKEEKGSATSRLLAWGWTDAHASFSASFSQWQPRSEQHKTGRDKNTSKEPTNNAKCAYLPLLITV